MQKLYNVKTKNERIIKYKNEKNQKSKAFNSYFTPDFSRFTYFLLLFRTNRS